MRRISRPDATQPPIAVTKTVVLGEDAAAPSAPAPDANEDTVRPIR
jgi:hypothetical protein